MSRFNEYLPICCLPCRTSTGLLCNSYKGRTSSGLLPDSYKCNSFCNRKFVNYIKLCLQGFNHFNLKLILPKAFHFTLTLPILLLKTVNTINYIAYIGMCFSSARMASLALSPYLQPKNTQVTKNNLKSILNENDRSSV